MKNRVILVICGPQGAGKSTLAHQIAEALGDWAEVTADDLTARFTPSELLEEPETLVVEEFSGVGKEAKILEIINSDFILVNEKGKERRMIDTPNFIFVTGSAEPIPLILHDRRFTVLPVK